MQRWFKIFAAVTAVGLVLFAGAYVFMRHPSLFTWRFELKIATGPIGSDGQKILAAFVREVAAERPIVRLLPVPTDSLAESGKALIDNEVDLAACGATTQPLHKAAQCLFSAASASRLSCPRDQRLRVSASFRARSSRSSRRHTW